MKTTKQWWEDVSQSEDKMIDWLKAQYHGELTAAKRINTLADLYNPLPVHTGVLKAISSDEVRHSKWVAELLYTRGITPKLLTKEERYWDIVTPPQLEVNTFSYACAVAHLAETMRLERITLLSTDSRFLDIAKVFTAILPDEEAHVSLFKAMTTHEDIVTATKFHNLGANAIGLTI